MFEESVEVGKISSSGKARVGFGSTTDIFGSTTDI